MYERDYIFASLSLVETHAHAHTHTHTLQRMFASFVMVVGVVAYGYIIASVAASLANADSARAQYQEKLNAVKSYMEVARYCTYIDRFTETQACLSISLVLRQLISLYFTHAKRTGSYIKPRNEAS